MIASHTDRASVKPARGPSLIRGAFGEREQLETGDEEQTWKSQVAIVF